MSAVADTLEYDLRASCRGAAKGSSWSALLVCINTKPETLDELLRTVGPPEDADVTREQVFDACADAMAIYVDAISVGADL